MGKPTSSAWREEALAQAAEMTTLLNWLGEESKAPNKHRLIEAVGAHLSAAQQGAHQSRGWWSTMNGASIERTFANLDAAEVNILRLAPPSYLRSNMSNFCVQATEHLLPDDPRLRRLRDLEKEADQRDLNDAERNTVVAAIKGAAEHGRREQMRVRSFRNVILFTTIMLALLAVAVAVVGFVNPDALPLCYEPDGTVVCPTSQTSVIGGSSTDQGPQAPTNSSAVNDAIKRADRPSDAALVEFVGLLGATLAAAVALRKIRGTSDPYSLPVALALLKVPTGALTAFLGLLLIRAQFVPGLSALDSSAQIIAWAIVLGYAQQLFTRAVDQQAETVLAQTSSSLRRDRAIQGGLQEATTVTSTQVSSSEG